MDSLADGLQRLDLSSSSRHSQAAPGVVQGHQQHSNLYVNNLPPNTSDAELSALFQPYGTVESLRVVRSAGKLGGPKCFAFIKLATIQQAVAAIRGLNNAQIGRSHLEVKFADADAGDRNPELSAPPSDNLYCKNLPGGFSEEDLRSLFSAYGKVTECRVLHKGDTQGSGALVRMGCVDEAARAVQHLHNQRVAGAVAPLVVRFADGAEQKAKRQARQHRQVERVLTQATAGPSSYGALGGDGVVLHHPMHGAMGLSAGAFMYGGADGYGVPAAALGAAGAGGQGELGITAASGAQLGGACSVYVKHLPEEADRLFLYEKFAPFGCVVSVKVMLDEVSGKCKGVGFVNYTDPESAARAVQAMNGMPMGERRLYVALQMQRNR